MATSLSIDPTIIKHNRPPRRFRRRWFFILAPILIIGIAGELSWWQATATMTNDTGITINLGKNATWLAHTWVGDPHSSGEYDALFTRLQRDEIRYLFVHTGPLQDTGTVDPQRYQYAHDFIAAKNRFAPEIKVLSWLGQIYRTGAVPGDGQIDLAQPSIREAIANTSAVFTHALGFDGIHLDIEPVPNNDSHFLDLLATVRQHIGSTSILSIATPNWIPIARVADAEAAITNRVNVWWTTYYYQKVSSFVDQIVVMLYNTDMPTAPLYKLIVEEETAHVIRSVSRGSATTKVLIGIPTYTGSSRSFHSSAENMRTGLEGVISGVNFSTFHPAFEGVAIYPEWLTTDADWQIYRQLWLGQ